MGTLQKNTPSETSPLLGRSVDTDDVRSILSQTLDPSAGLVPEGANAIGTYDDGLQDDDESGGDLERQVTNEGRLRQYEGQPEVKKRMKYIFPAVAVGVFLAAADQTLIVSSYGKIGTELNSLNNTSWVATAYFLTLTSCQPLYGKLSDIFGRKACLLFAYVVFGLGCLLCGLARTMSELIGARAFAGIGGGGMTTVVSILLSDAVSLRERGKWQGYVNIVYAAGAGIGAPMGGILADTVGWRWAFMGQAPLCLIAFISVGLSLNPPKRDNSHWKDKLRRIDFLGAIVLIGGVFTLLLGMDQGSNVSWRDRTTLIAIGTSIPLLAIFVIIETSYASEPFAPGHIIFNRPLLACYLCNFFAFSGWIAAIFYIPLYFQAVHGLTATEAGIRLIPSIICGVSGSLFGGFFMQKTGRYYWITVTAYHNLVIGMVIVLLFSGLVTASTPILVAGTMICGFSNGIGVTTSLIALIANSDHADQAVATACSYLFRSLGCVFGVSLSATFANQSLRVHLENALNGKDAGKIAEHVRQRLDYIKELDPIIREIVRDCYAKSTRAAFGVQVALVAGAALSAWFIKEKRLGR